MGALKDLQDEGKIRHVGVSNVSVEQLEQARAIVDVVTVQNRYNLEDRDSEDVLDRCEELGTSASSRGSRWRPAGSPRGSRWPGSSRARP